jgi:type III secretion apparatus needle protein
MPLNPDELEATMSSLGGGETNALKLALEKAQQNPQDPKSLIELQMAMQKWSMMNEMQSRLIQELGETVKNIINKMG